MARIDLPEGDGLDVGKALLTAPHFVDVVLGYEKAIAASPIDPRLHELVRYRIATINQCATCLEFRRPAHLHGRTSAAERRAHSGRRSPQLRLDGRAAPHFCRGNGA